MRPISRIAVQHASIRASPCRKLSTSRRPTPWRPPVLTRGGSCVQSGSRARRSLHLVSVLTPPLIFTGLFVALWCWKCTMLVVFQNTIIYNPFLPPDARRLTISEFARQCGRIKWREERIRSLDGTGLALCVTDVAPKTERKGPLTPVYVLYFQGNASSLPPRLPDISSILRRVQDFDHPFSYHVVCLSYRGYWTSHDRPSEAGINMDAQAALQWITEQHHERAAEGHTLKPVVILWGQSIGCGLATNLAAAAHSPGTLPVAGLVLETPFTNTRAMLQALYSQKWLPYQYLWPFLRNHLDSYKNMGAIAKASGGDGNGPAVYIVEAGRDELVPHDHGAILEKRCREVGVPVERYTISRSLHNDVMVRAEGKNAIAQAIVLATSRAQQACDSQSVDDAKVDSSNQRGPH